MLTWFRLGFLVISTYSHSALAVDLPSLFPRSYQSSCQSLWGHPTIDLIEQHIERLQGSRALQPTLLTAESAHALYEYLLQLGSTDHSSLEKSHAPQMWMRFAMGFHLLTAYNFDRACELGFSLLESPGRTFERERILELLDQAILHSPKAHPRWLVPLLASFTEADHAWRSSDPLELADIARLVQKATASRPAVEIPFELLRVRIDSPFWEFASAQWTAISAWELAQMRMAADVFAHYARQHGDAALAQRFDSAAQEFDEFLSIF